MNDDSVDSIAETAFVEATHKAAKLIGLPPECHPENAISSLDEALEIYKACNSLSDEHSFVVLLRKYIIPLLRGVKELIASPYSEKEMIGLLDRGFTFDQVRSAKTFFVKLAGTQDIGSADLVGAMAISLEDWMDDTYGPDMNHVALLRKFFAYLADGKNQFYY